MAKICGQISVVRPNSLSICVRRCWVTSRYVQAIANQARKTMIIHFSRAHLSLERNAPVPRRVEHPSEGKVIAIPQVGGLHHRYRRAA